MDRYLAANRALWDEWTAIHVRSQFYDVEGWKDGHDTAGLRIDLIHEHHFAVWQMYPFLVETEPRIWRLPAPLDGRLPLTFSLEATKT